MKLPTLALVHSPLVAADATWRYLAPALQDLGFNVVIAALKDCRISARHYWDQEVESAVESLAILTEPYILVGYSGAGPLLPLLAQHLPIPPAAYFFLDAGVLWQPASRLEMMYAEDHEWGKGFERYLREGGAFPAWTDEQLQPLLPDDEMRAALLASLQPKELAFFIETLPIPEGWDRIPCGYLRLSDSYRSYAATARAKGWTVQEIDTHHFAIMTEPNTIAAHISQITHALLNDDLE